MSDRRAILLLLVLGVVGAAVRLLSAGNVAPGAVAFHPSSASSARSTRDSSSKRAAGSPRRLRPGETVDFDTARSEQMARVPRIGPGLAQRIVKDRDEHGPFGSLEALRRVGGVGPVLLEALRPYATFSGIPSSAWTATSPPGGSRPTLRSDEWSILRSAESSIATTSRIHPSHRIVGRPDSPSLPVSLNTASVAELAQLPGIGLKTARAIVADRAHRGPFQTVEDLARVPGVGRGITQRLRGQIQVSP